MKIKMEIDKEKKRTVLERMVKLYEDWLSTRKSSEIREMRQLLGEAKKNGYPTRFTEAMKRMGNDGKTLLDMFGSNWTLFASIPSRAKLKIAEELHKATPKTKRLDEQEVKKDGSVVDGFNLAYMPIADRSNAMETYITPGNDRDLIVQIRNAVTGGNMSIAAELIKNGWGTLSLKERNGLIEWVNNIGKYNSNADVAASKNVKMMPMVKRSDVTKDDFANQFVRTALENMKIS